MDIVNKTTDDPVLEEGRVHQVTVDDPRVPLRVRVIENPGASQLLKLLDQWGRARFILDSEGNFFVWKAMDAIHFDILSGLNGGSKKKKKPFQLAIGRDFEGVSDAGGGVVDEKIGGYVYPPRPNRVPVAPRIGLRPDYEVEPVADMAYKLRQCPNVVQAMGTPDFHVFIDRSGHF